MDTEEKYKILVIIKLMYTKNGISKIIKEMDFMLNMNMIIL